MRERPMSQLPIIRRGGRSADRGAEHAFLPAALEVQHTPPSPVGRAIVWVIVVFFALAVGWAWIGEVDVVAVARGKIIPSGRTKLIQPAELGVVRGIHVEEGQWVEQGDVLVELDRTTSIAERTRIAAELVAARLDRARLRALLQALEEAEEVPPTLKLPRAEPASDASAVQQQLLRSQYAAYRSRLAKLAGDLAQRRAERGEAVERIRKLEATLPIITRRTEALESLAARQLASEHDYLALEQERIEQTQDLAAERKRLERIEAAMEATAQERAALHAQFRAQTLEQLNRTERTIAGLTQQLVKADNRATLQRLRAPIAGEVQQLAVHTLGGVVQPAQALMRIVPATPELEAEAWVPNKDIGFVREGQRAEVKVETFPFTKYGVIDAEVVDLSRDAIADESQGLVYAARVRLDRAHIRVAEKDVQLSPGMAVAVEIKTGKRRIIEFLLAPVLRAVEESARER